MQVWRAAPVAAGGRSGSPRTPALALLGRTTRVCFFGHKPVVTCGVLERQCVAPAIFFTPVQFRAAVGRSVTFRQVPTLTASAPCAGARVAAWACGQERSTPPHHSIRIGRCVGGWSQHVNCTHLLACALHAGGLRALLRRPAGCW
jgi:hypothetical protein